MTTTVLPVTTATDALQNVLAIWQEMNTLITTEEIEECSVRFEDACRIADELAPEWADWRTTHRNPALTNAAHGWRFQQSCI